MSSMRSRLWLCCALVSVSCSERELTASRESDPQPQHDPAPARPAESPSRDALPTQSGFSVKVKRSDEKPERTIDPDILANKPNKLFSPMGAGGQDELAAGWASAHHIREHNAAIEVVMSAQCSKEAAPRVRAADDGSIAIEPSPPPSCRGDAALDYRVRIEGLPSGEYTVHAAGLPERQVSIDAARYDRAVNEAAHRALERLGSPHTSKLAMRGKEATVHVYRTAPLRLGAVAQPTAPTPERSPSGSTVPAFQSAPASAPGSLE